MKYIYIHVYIHTYVYIYKCIYKCRKIVIARQYFKSAGYYYLQLVVNCIEYRE